MNPRRTELGLLIFAFIILSVGFVQVSIAISGSALTGAANAVLLGSMFLALHVANRIFSRNADPLILPITAFLTGTGLLMVLRLKPDLGSIQSIWVLVGTIAAIAVLGILKDYQWLKEYKYIWAVSGIILMFAPAFVGVVRGGSKLWIDFGFFSVQPAELAKLLFVFFLAAYLEEKHELLSISTKKVFGIWLPEAKHLGPLIVMWLLSLVILVVERDLGTSILFFGLFLAMLYVGTGRAMYVGIGSLLFVAGATACYFVFTHVQTRVDIWLNPWVDPSGKGYQIVQSLFAIASGRLAGTGLGLGHADIIPAVQTDFIFSAIAEELGLLGGVAIIVAYLLFAERGLRTARVAADDFGRLVAAGLAFVFALQTFIIIGGVTKLIPLTGVTLPYMSYGGSSIVMNFILLAILIRISARRGDAHG